MLRSGHGAGFSGCERARTSAWDEWPHLLTSIHFRVSTIRSAALPSHFGEIQTFFHHP